MLHASTHPHQALGRSPHTALTPIPEVPECSGKAASSPSPSERLDFDLGDAPGESTADERAEHATRVAAVSRRHTRELPLHRSPLLQQSERIFCSRLGSKQGGDANPKYKKHRIPHERS